MTHVAATKPRRAKPSNAASGIAFLREHSLATLAQNELERRILAGEIPVGAKLGEAEVATALGVSRGPVREAFRALNQAGLVWVEKNRGVFVRQLSLQEASEFYEVRAALEGLIGQLAAQRINTSEVEALRAVVRQMHQVQASTQATAQKAQDYFGLNVQFHDLLAQATRNSALLDNYRNVVKQLDLFRRATISRSTQNIVLSTDEHAAIVEAIAARDGARAEQLLRDHVLVSRQRLQQSLADASSTVTLGQNASALNV